MNSDLAAASSTNWDAGGLSDAGTAAQGRQDPRLHVGAGGAGSYAAAGGLRRDGGADRIDPADGSDADGGALPGEQDRRGKFGAVRQQQRGQARDYARPLEAGGARDRI